MSFQVNYKTRGTDEIFCVKVGLRTPILWFLYRFVSGDSSQIKVYGGLREFTVCRTNNKESWDLFNIR